MSLRAARDAQFVFGYVSGKPINIYWSREGMLLPPH